MSWKMWTRKTDIHVTCDAPGCDAVWEMSDYGLTLGRIRASAKEHGWWSGSYKQDTTRDFCPLHVPVTRDPMERSLASPQARRAAWCRIEVPRLLAEGKTRREIAALIGLSYQKVCEYARAASTAAP
jgi:hypothetical protein